MKKLAFLLLTVACIALVGCNKNDNNDPTEPAQPAQPTETEADFVLKFYTSDSLLQYFDYTIRDEKDTTIVCNYTIAKPDILNADKEDWQVIERAISKYEDKLNADNIKIITMKVHLAKSNKEHAFRILYTRNTMQVHSETINFILGGSIWKVVSSSLQSQTLSTLAHIELETSALNTFFSRPSAVNECTLSLKY